MASRSQILTDNNNSFPNNNSGQITPTILRDYNAELANSVVFNDQTSSMSVANATSASFATSASWAPGTTPVYIGNLVTTSSFNSFTSSIQAEVNALEAATSSYVQNSQTSSMSVLSASYALTASFALNGGGGGTVDTGSFATTGSNTFRGNQVISGSVNVSGSLVMNGLSPIQASHVKASDIQGLEILTNSNATVATFGQGGGTGATFTGQINAVAFSGSGAAVTGVISSSYALSASQAQNAVSANSSTTATSASFATTASYALNSQAASTFPFTGSALITGSLGVTGSVGVIGSLFVSGTINGMTFARSSNMSGSFQAGTIIGAEAGEGFDANTAIGYRANYLATSGVNNTYIGDRAGQNTNGQNDGTSGSQNTAVGAQALGGGISGTNNTALGSSAGSNVTTGNFNILIGSANDNITTGQFNTIIGGGYAGTTMASIASNLNNNIILADGLGNIRARYSGSWVLDGSVSASSGFTGSLLGTASFALNAAAAFPFTGSAQILGSLGVTGSIFGQPTFAATEFPFIVNEGGDGTSAFANLIFDRNTGATATGSVDVSGSANFISLNTGTPNAYVNGGGAGIIRGAHSIVLGAGVRVTGSNGSGYARQAPTFATSINSGLVTVTDNRPTIATTPLAFTANNNNGSITVTLSTGSVQLNNNMMFGNTGTIINITGSNGTSRAINSSILGSFAGNSIVFDGASGGNLISSMLMGQFLTASFTDANNAISSTSVLGYQLAISGAAAAGSTTAFGSTYVGRWNAIDSTSQPANTVFAVGAGTSNTARRTSFHVSSSGLTTIGNGLRATGSAEFSGSVEGEVRALTIASQTASLDLTAGNFFTLTLVSGSNTFLNPTNIQPGQTVNIRVTQPATPSTLTFAGSVKQPFGLPYTGSQTGSAVDVITFISYDNSSLLMSYVNNLV